MNAHAFGPDAVEADRLEREYDEHPPLGRCVICNGEQWSSSNLPLCDDCAHVPCQKCDGEQVVASYDGPHESIGMCPVCDGDGYVSRSTAKRLKWKLEGVR